jgi:hypothetical protein
MVWYRRAARFSKIPKPGVSINGPPCPPQDKDVEAIPSFLGAA